MSDEELLEMYEREWKILMNKVNEVEENIVQIRKRITSNAAQQMLAPDVAESPQKCTTEKLCPVHNVWHAALPRR